MDRRNQFGNNSKTQEAESITYDNKNQWAGNAFIGEVGKW